MSWRSKRRQWRRKYRKYLRSKAWKKKRERRLAMSDGMCEDCKVKPANHVHHLTYKRVFREWMKDLLPLCVDCHEKRHPRKRKFFRPKKKE